jgi:DNA-directed RNA polymerase subunit RPC12/RpoP
MVRTVYTCDLCKTELTSKDIRKDMGIPGRDIIVEFRHGNPRSEVPVHMCERCRSKIAAYIELATYDLSPEVNNGNGCAS